MSVWGTGLLKGLMITMRNMLRGPITVQYPREKLDLPERSRWTVSPIFDDEGKPKCTACMTCVKVCPDHVLHLEFSQGEDKTKHIEHFSYEAGACMMCGLCVEACPFDAICQTHDYELARTLREDLTYDLLADVDAAGPRRKAATQQAPERATQAPAQAATEPDAAPSAGQPAAEPEAPAARDAKEDADE